MPHEPILSRHRLPWNYRIALVGLWITPVILFTLAVLLSRGLTPAILDPRFLFPLGLMLIPALYVWREGVDVLPSGIIAHMHWPRYYPYADLDNWHFDSRADRRTLTVWDTSNRKVLECRAGHLTQLPMLLSALKANLRPRNWPS
jgi:hypothetical protein